MEQNAANQDFYLDNAATTRPFAEVRELVQCCLTDDFGNPSSVHPLGVKAKKRIDESREVFAGIFGVPTQGIIFTGSGTESDNLALKGGFGKIKPGDELITTPLEHAAVLNTARWLEEKGVRIQQVRIDPFTGLVDSDHLESLVDEKTKLVSIHHVNSETGIIQDLPNLSKIIKNKNPNCLFHSDGVQAFGKLKVELKGLGVDLYSISSHKFHGIKGAGALILNKKTRLEPLIHGGGQEYGLRSGTESVPLIASMGLAASMMYAELASNMEKIQSFVSSFIGKLKESLPELQIFETERKIPHILSLAYPKVPGEVLLHHLAEQRIYVSTGSACHASAKQLSATLTALRFTPQRIKETIRVSLDPYEIPSRPGELARLMVEVILQLKKFA